MGTSSLRILIVSDLYPPVYQGGYELVCKDVADRLSARGHEVHILTSRHLAATAEPSPRQSRMLRFRESRVPTLLAREWSDNRIARAVALRVRPDVISVWNAGGLTKSILYSLEASGAPMTYYVHDDWLTRQFVHDRWLCLWKPEMSSGLERFAKQVLALPPISRLASRVAPIGGPLDLSHIAFVSRYLRSEAVRVGLCTTTAAVIHAGVDAKRFVRSRATHAERPLRLLFAGRLVPEKGVAVAIEGLAAILERRPGSCRLTLAGEPRTSADEQSLRDLIARLDLGSAIDVIGRVERAHMPDVYRAHDGLVFPSKGPEGGVPLAVMEALAAGLVVIGSITGGTAELLSDGHTGLTFPVGDTKRLADCVERLLDEPALGEKLATTGKAAVAKHFTLDRAVDEFEAFLIDAAAKRRAALP